MINKCYYSARYPVFLIILLISFSAKGSHDQYPQIWNVPYHNEHFTGRDIFLKDLHSAFDTQDVLAIVGMPGIGKTQVAKRYAEMYKQNFDVVWWFDGNKGIIEQYKHLAIELNKFYSGGDKLPLYAQPEILAEYVKNCLRTSNLNWLLIFDNSSNDRSILKYLPEKHSQSLGKILITTTNSMEWKNIMKLDKFSRKESINFLGDLIHEKDLTILENIAEVLGDYPLALSQSAAFLLANPSIDTEQYIELFKARRQSLWEKEKKLKDNNFTQINQSQYQETVFTALSMSINNIKVRSQNAFDLLAFCAFLNNELIPEQLLSYLLSTKDILEFNEALHILTSYSILNKNDVVNTDSENKTYSMHATFQLVMQDLLTDKEKKNYISKVQSALSTFLPERIEELQPLIANNLYLLDHVKSVAEHAIEAGLINEDHIKLLLRQVEYYLLGPLDYKQTGELIKIVDGHLANKVAISNMLLAQFYYGKSIYCSWVYGDHKTAIIEANKAVGLLKSISNRTEDLLNIYLQLAQFYIYQGDIDNANKNITLTETILKDPEYAVKLGVYHAVKSKIEIDRGNFELALFHSQKAIQIEKELNIGENTPGEVTIYLLECEALLKMGKNQEVYDKTVKINSMMNDFYKNESHEIQARVLTILSAASLRLGKINEAKDATVKASKILDATYGVDGNHLDIANSLLIKADIFAFERDYMKAKEYYIKTYNMYKAVLVTDQIDDYSYLYSQLAINAANLRNNHQMETYLKLHIEKFGREHVRTIQILRYFAKEGLKVPL